MFHPGIALSKYIQDKGRTQKEFANFCNKNTSEINELIKGKRKITIQWDLILHKVLNTPEKFWIDKQTAYDYEIAKQMFDDSLILSAEDTSEEEQISKEIEDTFSENTFSTPKKNTKIQDIPSKKEKKISKEVNEENKEEENQENINPEEGIITSQHDIFERF